MRACLITAMLGIAAAAPRPAHAQSPDPLLEHLVGRWVLRGPMAGQNVVHDVSAAWVLNHEYIELRETSRERTAAGEPAYEAIVYVGRNPKTHEYAALWMDNTAYGGFVPQGTGHAVAIADSIPFTFADSSGINFRNTFIYDRGRDSWEWHLDNVDGKSDHPFARVALTRAHSP